VWVSDVNDLDSALEMIYKIGQLTRKENESAEIIKGINNNFSKINKATVELHTLYLIWKDPFMAAGSDTFINSMLMHCGMKNILATGSRYPELAVDDIRNLHADVILLSSEPYPFSAKHIEEIKSISPGTLCLTVDGECFSWYGSHLLKSPAYFNELISKIKTSERIQKLNNQL
jgi:ABC-type hemin transport system substrate-binding protein